MAYWMVRNYREAYDMFCVNGILHNHESPRRGETFVTRKITRALARIQAGIQQKLYLGNLDAKRDWGYAPDYTDAMWRMLQQDKPDDYVIATGETHSVRDFLDEAAGQLGLDWKEFVEFDPRYLRPTEVDELAATRRRRARAGLEADRDLQGARADHGRRRREAARGRAGGPHGAVDGIVSFWGGRRVCVTGGAGFLGKAVTRDLEELGAEVRVIRSAEHDLRARGRARAAVEGAEIVIHLAARVGGIGFNRRNPAPLAYDNLMMAANVFEQSRLAGVREAGRGLLGLRLSEAHPGAVLRGRHLERLPGGVERPVRAGQEDAAGALRRLPAPVRVRLVRAGDRQPLRPGGQLRPRGLARDRGDDRQVRRRPAARRGHGDALGDGVARRASSSTSTTPRARCCWPPSGSTPRSR